VYAKKVYGAVELSIHKFLPLALGEITFSALHPIYCKFEEGSAAHVE
jgi:hypothetical protein